MRPDKILAVCTFAMLSVGLAIHLAASPIPVAKPRYVPIEQVPAQIGQWTQVSVLPIPDAVRQKLPTAHILDRMYANAQGQTVELMLLTATRRDDMHDPARCLPSQGWNVTQQSHVQLGSQTATYLTIEQDGNSADAYYWLTGYYSPTNSRNSLVSLLDKVRGHIISRQQGMSLFVRLMTADGPSSTASLNDFAAQIEPVLDKMKVASLRRGEQVALSNGEAATRA